MGIPDKIWQDAEWMGMMLPLLRSDFTLLETYTAQHSPLLDCPITVFGGVEDPLTNIDNLTAWRETTQKEFTLHMLPGGHFFINEEQEELMRVIAQTLEGI